MAIHSKLSMEAAAVSIIVINLQWKRVLSFVRIFCKNEWKYSDLIEFFVDSFLLSFDIYLIEFIIPN